MTKTVVASKSAEPLRFKLEPLPYVVVVRTAPEGGVVSSGSHTAVSPAPLELGHLDGGVQVSVAKDGYQRVTRLVRLDEFTERNAMMKAELDVALSPLPPSSSHPH